MGTSSRLVEIIILNHQYMLNKYVLIIVEIMIKEINMKYIFGDIQRQVK